MGMGMMGGGMMGGGGPNPDIFQLLQQLLGPGGPGSAQSAPPQGGPAPEEGDSASVVPGSDEEAMGAPPAPEAPPEEAPQDDTQNDPLDEIANVVLDDSIDDTTCREILRQILGGPEENPNAGAPGPGPD